MSTYPADRRDHKFFAHRFCRLLAKTCAAQDIGNDGCWLLTVIALLEDSKRYTDAVTFYNGQLMPVAGFTRKHTFIAARKRCIRAGWLHYEAGSKRKPGRYWVTIPSRFSELPDGPCDETGDETDTQSADRVTNLAPIASPNASPKADPKRHSFLPSPVPCPDPKEESARKPRFTDDDRRLAEHMLTAITENAGKPTKPPNLDKWAETIRRMRQRDKHTLDDIRELFDWANQDQAGGSNGWAGWAAVIRSPENLREKWDKITAQKQARERRRGGRGGSTRDAAEELIAEWDLEGGAECKVIQHPRLSG